MSNIRKPVDLDPAPRGWARVDPHSYRWDEWLGSEEPCGEYQPGATYTVERTVIIRYGQHHQVRRYRVITTHPNTKTDNIISTNNNA